MPYTWPATIPPPSQSFSGSVNANVLRDKEVNGPVGTKYRNNVITRTYTLSWDLDSEQRVEWVEAYIAAQNGNDWVDIELPLRGIMETHRVRFSNQGYGEQHNTHFRWLITLEVEIFDLQLLTSDEIDGLVTWVDYKWPQELPRPNNVVDLPVYWGNIRMAIDNTMFRQRQRFSRPFKRWEITFRFTGQEKYIFESIYQNKLQSSNRPIELPLPIAEPWNDDRTWDDSETWFDDGSGVTFIETRFLQQYEFSMLSDDLYDLTIQCEESLAGTIAPVTIER